MSTRKRKIAKSYAREFNRYVRHRIKAKIKRGEEDLHTKRPRNSGKWNAS